MKLYIPHLKEELTLAEDWTFTLYKEHRNYTLIARLREYEDGSSYSGFNWEKVHKDFPIQMTIPKDTVLKVDRIYIRQGQRSYDSITFRIGYSPEQRLEKARFWAKLDDVNTMEVVL